MIEKNMNNLFNSNLNPSLEAVEYTCSFFLFPPSYYKRKKEKKGAKD